ncbi:MAG TPA: SMP-30/gluconolactonase/LRE family protein [Steroidobacteraceae bacterium]|jgi:sugar lactone lactonase YvrE
MQQPEAIISAANVLGEGILWDDAASVLWWTDIQSKELLRYDWASQRLERKALPHRLGSFGLVQGSSDIIAAFENGIALYHPESAALQWISQPAAAHPHLRFNDGRVDRQGRFWTGTMIERKSATADATLYCVAANGTTSEHERGLRITNGICASPDGRRLYLADSPRAIIYSYDLDPDSGTLLHRRIFARTSGGAVPDGANVDEHGCVWSAQWGGSRVVRYTPDGKVDQILEVPVSQPTCVAFGGADRDLLFVSSARDDLSAAQLAQQPHAGDVLVYRVGSKGLPEPRFRGNLRTPTGVAFA